MYEHAPEGYVCLLCLVVQGVENEHVHTRQADVFYQDEWVTAFVSSVTWEHNHGNALVIPNEHRENIYIMPDEVLAKVQAVGKSVAIAMKSVYGCDGVTFLQHNEPAGNQEVWHYHLHVLPRYEGDQFYPQFEAKQVAEPTERANYATRLREYFRNYQV